VAEVRVESRVELALHGTSSYLGKATQAEEF